MDSPGWPATDAVRWYPGARVSRLRASHSYGFVLLLIVTSFVFIAAAPDASWSRSILVLLQSGTLVAALWTSGLGRAAVIPSVALAAFGASIATLQLVDPSDTLIGAAGVVDALLVVSTALVVGVGIADQGAVNRQSVLGAICIYLLLGILFTFVYGAVATLGSADFFAQGTDGTPSLRLYFSFTTLATIGYGDYTTAGDLGHTLSVSEGLVGQLYLVTVVALVVGRLRRQSPKSDD
jgi:ion channel